MIYCGNQSTVTQLGIGETYVRKGHDYVTVAADLATRRVIHVAPSKGWHTIGRIKDHLKAKCLMKLCRMYVSEKSGEHSILKVFKYKFFKYTHTSLALNRRRIGKYLLSFCQLLERHI
ncbi:hypothetical protein RCC89_11170 [Cytophagaceae bacterium ABcell3]|nr:hypothetical protein RCC89_11170 [Cytophagaceae bacterium ABcell3]